MNDIAKKLRLYETHVEQGAKMAPFAGFLMPIQYTSIKEEVLAVRNKSGVFDVSHMGEFFVEGKEALEFVDYMITNDIKNAPLNKAIYSPICREDGSTVDDLLAYKIGKEKILICVNASNIQKDWEFFNSHISKFDCTIKDESNNYSLLALQGPETENILKEFELIPTDGTFIYYSAQEFNYQGEQIIIARTGYTGEDGVEIFAGHELIHSLWKKFMDRKVTPCGLASRDVLRLEVCYPLYGHELTDEITPLDSALKWAVKLKKEKLICKQALENYIPKYRQVKLTLEKGIPRENYPVLNSLGETVGKVTSGTMSVVLGKGIALAHVEKEKFPENNQFFINIRNRQYKAERVKKAFVTGGHK